MKLNFIVGRFQPLHDDHVNLIQSAINTSDVTLVLIGCSDTDGTSKKNPFTFEQRSSLIQNHFLNDNLFILPLYDKGCNEEWLKELENTITEFTQESFNNIFFVCCDKDDSTTESNNLIRSKYSTISIPHSSSIDATSIRTHFYNDFLNIPENIPKVTSDFLKEIRKQQSLDFKRIENILIHSKIPLISEALDRACISLNDWELSCLYSYLDTTIVGCSECSLYKPPQEYGASSTKQVFESMNICNTCKELLNE